MKAPFPVTPALSAIAIAYRNSRLIADDVLPRVPVSNQEFKYRKYALGDGFTVPNTLVGRMSKPNQVEIGFTEVTDSTRDYALDDPIPQADILNAPEGVDLLAKATEYITDLIALDRECRTATVVFDAANYAAANKTALAGNDQWSDYTNSHPIKDIMDALDSCIIRPNVMVLGRVVYAALVQHPELVKAYHGTLGESGVVPRNFLATIFELEDVLVGEGWLNTAKKGQNPTISRVWGNKCSLIVRSKLADTRNGLSFGVTAEWGNRVAGSITDEDLGMRGGQRVRVGESVKEVICANDLGYLFSDAVAVA